jgi:endonuclease/exonuclease/phosphatase family metal-dependent hydrolase
MVTIVQLRSQLNQLQGQIASIQQQLQVSDHPDRGALQANLSMLQARAASLQQQINLMGGFTTGVTAPAAAAASASVASAPTATSSLRSGRTVRIDDTALSSGFREGTWRGSAEGLSFEFRIQLASDGTPEILSGDVFRGSAFLASLVCEAPSVDVGGAIIGPVIFRGNPDLFTGSVFLQADARGVGSFRVTIDVEGGHSDTFAGRLDWQGSFLRRVTIEIDGLAGTMPPEPYVARSGVRTSVESAFERAGFDVNVVVDSFTGRGPTATHLRGFTLGEIHRGMQQRRNRVPPDRLHAHVFVCSYLAGRDGRGVLGVMYDFEENDLNRKPREGVAVFYDHPMLSDPRVPPDERTREYVFTLVHEIGHALNLLHSFDKARPMSLSWMNYPHLFPRGYEAEPGYDGTNEFWRQFGEVFDREELQHLHHASPREIRAGGFAFGTYEDDKGPFGGRTDPRRTRLGANPLRAMPDVKLGVAPVNRIYELGEPVYVYLSLKNESGRVVHIPDAFDPSEGYTRFTIRTPGGRVVRYQPPVRLCKQAQMFSLGPSSDRRGSDGPGIPLFVASDGPLFTEPGVYQILAEMTGVDGNRTLRSDPVMVAVKTPGRETERVAYEVWDNRDILTGLYLRHPLAVSNWTRVNDELATLPEDHTLRSWYHYVSGLGWLTPFTDPDSGREKGADPEKAAAHFARVAPNRLPASVAKRASRLLRPYDPKKREGAVSVAIRGAVTPREMAEQEIPPSGLFGSLGLFTPNEDLRERSQRDGISPFVRVVPTLVGRRGFADIVSWNIEHLHRSSNRSKIPAVAHLIRSMRCDFWGLQEVSESSLAELTETLNTAGRLRHDFVAVQGQGQQSGALFRIDTTTVSILDVPEDLFGEEIEVRFRDGRAAMRKVFLRAPLLLQVRVRQSATAVFDFRCAVVHLKSTDRDFADEGAGMRARASEILAEWIRRDRQDTGETDYIVMGDMNAETDEQGLSGFLGDHDLATLSVGMRERHGTNALTRVASGRLLDHIVVTSDAFTKLPEEDENEMIIIRSDTRIERFTESLSDHIPVAVRFVMKADDD